MSIETLQSVIAWQNTSNNDTNTLEITIHGGEPLVPGALFYQSAFPLLCEGKILTVIQRGTNPTVTTFIQNK